MLIEVDEYKKRISGYEPAKSELFHRESARLADKDFISCLKSRKYKKIIFMAGGTASGKTEFAMSYLTKKDQLIYDGTLKNFDGFKIKLQNIKKYDKNSSKIKVVLIIPEDIVKSFGAFLKRERKMKTATFFDTHIRSKLSVAKILLYTKNRVEVYVSRVMADTDKLTYIKLSLGRKRMAKDLFLTSKALYKIAMDAGLALDINPDNM